MACAVERHTVPFFSSFLYVDTSGSLCGRRVGITPPHPRSIRGPGGRPVGPGFLRATRTRPRGLPPQGTAIPMHQSKGGGAGHRVRVWPAGAAPPCGAAAEPGVTPGPPRWSAARPFEMRSRGGSGPAAGAAVLTAVTWAADTATRPPAATPATRGAGGRPACPARAGFYASEARQGCGRPGAVCGALRALAGHFRGCSGRGGSTEGRRGGRTLARRPSLAVGVSTGHCPADFSILSGFDYTRIRGGCSATPGSPPPNHSER